MRSILWVARNYLARRGDGFDAHPDLLNVRNGVVDLRDGTLGPHDPELLFTKVTMTDYLAGRNPPGLGKALTAVTPTKADWLQIRFGQGLTGYPPPDDILVVLKGSGENGKTTVIDGVRGAAGVEYAIPLPDRVLLARPGDHPTEMMTLRDARLAFMEEFPELGHLNVKRLKDLTGTEWHDGALLRQGQRALAGDTHGVRHHQLPAARRRIRPRHLAAAGAGGVPPPLPQGRTRPIETARRTGPAIRACASGSGAARTGSTRPCSPG